MITKTNRKMFTWNETVALCLITVLRDPELVYYFMGIVKPMRIGLIEEEARVWHKSLRVTQEERWKRIADLSKRRKFAMMNNSVPITCTLPFDGGMWRNSRELLKMIRHFRKGFIRKYTNENMGVGETYRWTIDETISNKIKIVNLIKDKNYDGIMFNVHYSEREVDEALNDLITYESDPEPDWSWEEYPYIILDDVQKEVKDTFIVVMN